MKRIEKDHRVIVRTTSDLWLTFKSMANVNDDNPSQLIRNFMIDYLDVNSVDPDLISYYRITDSDYIDERKIKKKGVIGDGKKP